LGLQLLHTLNALAIDGLLDALKHNPSDENKERFAAIASVLPGLQGWDRKRALPGYPQVANRQALAQMLGAHVVITPLMTSLFYFRKPFSMVKPIGIGDLKVVKQWLTAYRPGEISRIHPIMKGEERAREHRRVEKSEEVYSLASSRSEDKSQDTQST